MEFIIGSTKDNVAGLANNDIGNIKQGVGMAVGSVKIRVDGKVQEIKGDGQRAIGAVKDQAKYTANQAAEYLSKWF